VNRLLSFSHASEEDKTAIHIHELLSTSLSLTGTQVRKEGIKLKVNSPPALPEIIAHPQQIEQVFLNIINNARHALNQKYPGAHEDKILEITCEQATIADCPYVRVIFCDHGVGIPAHLQDKVINPFFSTKPKGVGTGLGLSISHGIISDHGGKLKIESVEGQYTRMIIDLSVRRDA
jgi:signal transduction histidine kinase